MATKLPPTQKYVPIYEIRDNVVVMRDGTLRVVMLTSSINFTLKSEEEQDAVVQAYIQFLNSFSFPVQIVVQSRRLNIDPYMEKLELLHKKQNNELLKQQTRTYITYINELVNLGDIMTKRFYVVVPYDPLFNKPKDFWQRIKEVFSASRFVKLSKKRFEDRRKNLFSRVEIIRSGLANMGLNPIVLDTQSLVELYRDSYNISVSERQKMGYLDELRVEQN